MFGWKVFPKLSTSTLDLQSSPKDQVSSKNAFSISCTKELSNPSDHVQRLGLWNRYSIFAPFVPTTIISFILLAASSNGWTIPRGLQQVILGNRGSIQLVVQVIATSLGLLHTLTVSTAINYSTRLRLASKTTTSLNSLLFWHSLLSKQFTIDLSLQLVVVLLIFFGCSAVPAALWAAAITPISAARLGSDLVSIPQYSNVTLLELSQVNEVLLPTISSKGTFSFMPGETLLGPLLNSAATATTTDGGVREHPKLDHSSFTYYGRSYGIGASIGLVDDHVLENSFTTQYTFQETGYFPAVSCIYNTSSAYHLINDTVDMQDGQNYQMFYAATGTLPNIAKEYEEWDRYPGYSTDVIVAMTAAPYRWMKPHMIGIASGASYTALNQTQCTIDYRPTLFNVAVDVRNRNIRVTPMNTTDIVADIDTTGYLPFFVTKQFHLIARDQATMWSSLVGNSFNASINSYIASVTKTTGRVPEIWDATLAGLENSVAAMVDDILIAYASAQIMILNDTETVSAVILEDALKVGEALYIYIIVILNGVLFLVVAAEAIRTRGWHGLTNFDYMDPRNLVVGSSKGGSRIADIVDEIAVEDKTGSAGCREIGDVKIRQDGSSIVLGSKSERFEVRI